MLRGTFWHIWNWDCLANIAWLLLVAMMLKRTHQLTDASTSNFRNSNWLLCVMIMPFCGRLLSGTITSRYFSFSWWLHVLGRSWWRGWTGKRLRCNGSVAIPSTWSLSLRLWDINNTIRHCNKTSSINLPPEDYYMLTSILQLLFGVMYCSYLQFVEEKIAENTTYVYLVKYNCECK